VHQGEPNVVNLIASGDVRLVINTPFGRGARADGYEIRTTALRKGVAQITTLAGASAAVSAIEAAKRPKVQVHCLQDLHAAADGS
jgi:carbamoyl-phosphate synthase large subunit